LAAVFMLPSWWSCNIFSCKVILEIRSLIFSSSVWADELSVENINIVTNKMKKTFWGRYFLEFIIVSFSWQYKLWDSIISDAFDNNNTSSSSHFISIMDYSSAIITTKFWLFINLCYAHLIKTFEVFWNN